MNAPASSLEADLNAALEWWRMAGVDCDFAEDATDWLAQKAEQEAPAPPAKRVTQVEQDAPNAAPPTTTRADLLGPNPPADLSEFRQFWLEAPGLDAIGPRGRVAARGPVGADLMVLVINPEERDGVRLLAGPQGQFLSRILAAMGVGEDETYIASALPSHTPMADTASLAAAGMDAVVLRHIELAAPKRLIAFGAHIPPLLGHASTKDISSLREINQNAQKLPLLVSEGLDSLMGMPGLKARFWRRWMEWSADL